MCSSLPSGKSATPPARCIHRPQRDTSSPEYRLLVSRAFGGASRELSSRRSPALAPHTCAVSPTFRYGAFVFVVFALADLSSARLTAYGNNAQTGLLQQLRVPAYSSQACLGIPDHFSPCYFAKKITQYNIVVKPITNAIKRYVNPLINGRLTQS